MAGQASTRTKNRRALNHPGGLQGWAEGLPWRVTLRSASSVLLSPSQIPGLRLPRPTLLWEVFVTYDLNTDAGKVRLLVSDTNVSAHIFTDTEIDTFLTLEGSIKLAAAQALDTIADNEALAAKVITTQDLTIDGAKLADSLRKRAVALRAQVVAEIEVESGHEFSIAAFEPYIPTPAELTEWAL